MSKVQRDVKKVEVSKGRPSNSIITPFSSCTRSSYKWNPCPVPSPLASLMVHCGLVRISFLSLGCARPPGPAVVPYSSCEYFQKAIRSPRQPEVSSATEEIHPGRHSSGPDPALGRTPVPENLQCS